MRLSDYRVILLVASCLFFGNSVRSAETTYSMQGIVTDADTSVPVAGATVQVLIESEADFEKRLRTAKSTADGRYSIELPAGHGSAWTLLPPAGYVPAEAFELDMFATTADKPTYTKNYKVRKGIPIRVAVRPAGKLTIPAGTHVSLYRNEGNTYVSGDGELDRDGTGWITLPETSGEFELSCWDLNRSFSIADKMSVDFEKGFDPANVSADIKRGEDGIRIVRDAEGRTATLHGCDVTIADKAMTVVIDATAENANNLLCQLRGMVVDDHGDGIKGASLRMAFVSQGGGASSSITAKTGDTGSFVIGVPKLRDGQKISLTVSAEGYAARQTAPIDLKIAENGEADAGKIKMDVGSSIRVRVVGPDGAPLYGAIVEPYNDFASRTRTARTGPDGECKLSGLAAETHLVSARFGTLGTSTKIPLERGENELVVLKLAPPRTAPAAGAAELLPVLSAGKPAPEWDIAEWTDGKKRNLVDYRGKVVVLDFWGVWCGPCIHSIAAMKELEDLYKERGVVFIALHTAGTDMTVVKRMLKEKDWKTMVGLDSGDDVGTGATVRRFGVHGFPTIFVIDANGNVAFNSSDPPKDRDAFMRDMQALAEANLIPWPPDKDGTEEQIKERLTRMAVLMFEREIEKALKVKAE